MGTLLVKRRYYSPHFYVYFDTANTDKYIIGYMVKIAKKERDYEMEIKEQELQKLEQQVKELQEQINKIKIPNKRNIIDKLKEKSITRIGEDDDNVTLEYATGPNNEVWCHMLSILKEVLKSEFEFSERVSNCYGYQKIHYDMDNYNKRKKEKILFENLEREVYQEIINMADELVAVYNKYFKMFHQTALVKFMDIPYSVEVKVGENLNEVKQREKQKAKQKIEQSIAQCINL